jgi:hypothetical protein
MPARPDFGSAQRMIEADAMPHSTSLPVRSKNKHFSQIGKRFMERSQTGSVNSVIIGQEDQGRSHEYPFILGGLRRVGREKPRCFSVYKGRERNQKGKKPVKPFANLTVAAFVTPFAFLL